MKKIISLLLALAIGICSFAFNAATFFAADDLLTAADSDFESLEDMLYNIYNIKDNEIDSEVTEFKDILQPLICTGYNIGTLEYYLKDEGSQCIMFGDNIINDNIDQNLLKPDPKNRMYQEYGESRTYYYFMLNADNVDWVAKNIFNVEPNHSLDVYEEIFIDGYSYFENMYYYDGYYYLPAGDAGYIGHTAKVKDYQKTGDGKYYVTVDYEMEFDEPYNEKSTNYMLVGLKNIDGRKYWSVYKNSKSPFDYSEKNISVILNGEELAFDAEPYIENGTTMVPMRAIFEALGAEVMYEAETKTITAAKGGTTIELVTGSNSAKINGRPQSLSVAVANKNGSTMIPLRFVSEALGAAVDWNGETKTITISD